jgi:DNA-binding NarL/FixJ family response regulator
MPGILGRLRSLAASSRPGLELVHLDVGVLDDEACESSSSSVQHRVTVSVTVRADGRDHPRLAGAAETGALELVLEPARRSMLPGASDQTGRAGACAGLPPDITDRGHPALAEPALRRTQAPAGNRGLTRRQTQVLALMMVGKSNKAICRCLGIAEATVKIHVSAVLKALEATNRTEAVMAAMALGFAPATG